VKAELSKEAAWVSSIDALSSAVGYRCLGYQTKLFEQDSRGPVARRA
jgi:hypothetical protein